MEQEQFLGNVADHGPPGLEAHPVQGHPVDRDPPAVGLDEPGHEIDDGRFPRPGRPLEQGRPAGPDLEGDVFEDDPRPAAERDVASLISLWNAGQGPPSRSSFQAAASSMMDLTD